MTKKKPEVKAKPKVAKVIPVVKSVSTKVITPTGPVGFKSLPKQLHRRAIRHGFQFTLMVVGESGLGKSTLVNSMFLTDIYSSVPGRVEPAEEQTLAVAAHRLRLEEGGVRLALTVLDTPGFGDLLDNSSAWHPVATYIEEQYDKWLEAETLAVQRREVEDTRVHACLYFIPPGGHRLRQLDLEFMRRLGGRVNIIPVIGGRTFSQGD
jgi:septin 7